MHFFLRTLVLCILPALSLTTGAADLPEAVKVLPQPYADPRATTVRTLYQGSGFHPYTDLAAWRNCAAFLREQVLIAAGLWPMPEKCPLNAVIHSPVDRGGYTVEKVFFQSYPGFYVTGSLYRPKGKAGPFPVILSPHGHWKDGRFYDAGEKEAQKQIAGGWEKETDAARYPLQARCANLAKLGCIVFHYDMVGYADSDPEHFPHRQTYRDIDSDQRLISVFGLQTWDSIRALDFVLSLPDVDPTRTACTGASGGATQTFMLMAIDDRLKFAAPVCMISAGDHQGGCVCENNSLLRVGTDNVELAAAFAPKPFIHPTATGDWTNAFMEHGYPEIKATYKLFDAEDNMEAVRYQANHNYNLKSREAVYNFFNKQMKLGHPEPIVEQKFTPILPKDLSVFDADHPRPANAVDSAGLKKYLIESAAKQMDLQHPANFLLSGHGLTVLRTAAGHMLSTELPPVSMVKVEIVGAETLPQYTLKKAIVSRSDLPLKLPLLVLTPIGPSRGITILVTGTGKSGVLNADGSPGPLATALLADGQTVFAPDVFMTGELAGSPLVEKVDGKPVEFRAGYNRTTIGNRVQDILTTITAAQVTVAGDKPINLVGIGTAGPWCLLARPLAGERLMRVAADANHFDFNSVKATDDENYLPGSLRYGGLWPLASVGATGSSICVFNTGSDQADRCLKVTTPPERLRWDSGTLDPKTLAAWIAR